MDGDWDDLDDRINPPEFAPTDLTSALSGPKMLGDDVYLRMQATNVGVVDNRRCLRRWGRWMGRQRRRSFYKLDARKNPRAFDAVVIH